MDAIRANIFATLDYELQHAKSKNEKAHRILRDGYRSLVFEDKLQLDGATIDQVAKKFKDFLDSEPGTSGTRFRWCLVIDERVLLSFIRHPEPVEFSAPPSQGGIKKNGVGDSRRPRMESRYCTNALKVSGIHALSSSRT